MYGEPDRKLVTRDGREVWLYGTRHYWCATGREFSERDRNNVRFCKPGNLAGNEGEQSFAKHWEGLFICAMFVAVVFGSFYILDHWK